MALNEPKYEFYAKNSGCRRGNYGLVERKWLHTDSVWSLELLSEIIISMSLVLLNSDCSQMDSKVFSRYEEQNNIYVRQ